MYSTLLLIVHRKVFLIWGHTVVFHIKQSNNGNHKYISLKLFLVVINVCMYCDNVCRCCRSTRTTRQWGPWWVCPLTTGPQTPSSPSMWRARCGPATQWSSRTVLRTHVIADYSVFPTTLTVAWPGRVKSLNSTPVIPAQYFSFFHRNLQVRDVVQKTISNIPIYLI